MLITPFDKSVLRIAIRDPILAMSDGTAFNPFQVDNTRYNQFGMQAIQKWLYLKIEIIRISKC